jgi:hypothetical protein
MTEEIKLYTDETTEADKNFLAEEMLRSYYKGKILKYLLHEREKNGLEDLKKARKHLDWWISKRFSNFTTYRKHI